MMNAKLHDICTRIARLEADRKAIADEISEIKKAAKEDGYDTALIGKTVRLINMKPGKRQAALEQHELFDTYLAAAGLLPEFEPTSQHDPVTGEVNETPASFAHGDAGQEGGDSSQFAPPSELSEVAA